MNAGGGRRMNEEAVSPDVLCAAQWLADQHEPPKLAVPALKERFGLSTLEACKACTLANRFRIARRAFG